MRGGILGRVIYNGPNQTPNPDHTAVLITQVNVHHTVQGQPWGQPLRPPQMKVAYLDP